MAGRPLKTSILTRLLLLLTAVLTACNGKVPSDKNVSQTIDQNELLFKKGDCLEFKIDSLTYGAGIVFDFSRYEGGIWYCLLFTDYESTTKPTIDSILHKKFIGRKIENPQNEKGYQIMLDGAFIRDSLINANFKLVGHLSLNNNGRLGEQKPTSEMDGLIQLYKNEKQRITSANKFSFDFTNQSKFWREEYFDLKDFVKLE
ncbi:MAG: hypothetical protein K0Q95_1476 [Bacteroidota bacterium]|jgi:hypothetical protein|nr:hypothetical protein [Bacteroidota bacterium]